MSTWLSWSAFSQYEQCSKQYDYQRVSKEDPPEKDSRHNAIVGSVVQSTFEDFYNQQIWKQGSTTSDRLFELAEGHFKEFVEGSYIDLDDYTCRFDSVTEALKEIYEIIPKTLEGIKREKLIGPYAVSEKEFKVRYKNDFLYGYMDFIIRQENDEIMLLDGKSSRHRDKYVDPDQLYFYALMFYKKYQKLPDKLGFFYYRFADDEDKAFDWIQIDKSKFSDLESRIDDVLLGIHNYDFEANPNYKWCQWCPYERICEPRQKQKRNNRMKRKMNSKKKEIELDEDDEETSEDGNEGVVGFDSLD